MPAGEYNFTIEQGATLQQELIWKATSGGAPINNTGYTARMQIRSILTSPTVLLELLSTGGSPRITLGGADGKITLNLTATETSAITWVTGVYDLELVSPTGVVTRVIKGTITVDPEVTR